MSPHRFFAPPEACGMDSIRLPDAEAHHARRVLRARVGDRATVLNGCGSRFECEIATASGSEVTLKVLEQAQAPAPACRVTLFQAIPKGKTLETIIQKATELGVTKIVPIITGHVVARPHPAEFDKKENRWQNAAIEAVKQCGQHWLPRVDAPETLSHALRRRESLDLEFIGALSDAARHPREWFNAFSQSHGHPPESLGVWIGPEGDFTSRELGDVINAGARPISLGPLVLRCDTAAIYCLSIAGYETSAP